MRIFCRHYVKQKIITNIEINAMLGASTRYVNIYNQHIVSRHWFMRFSLHVSRYFSKSISIKFLAKCYHCLWSLMKKLDLIQDLSITYKNKNSSSVLPMYVHLVCVIYWCTIFFYNFFFFISSFYHSTNNQNIFIQNYFNLLLSHKIYSQIYCKLSVFYLLSDLLIMLIDKQRKW